MNRTPHMDQIISKIQRQRKNITPYTFDTKHMQNDQTVPIDSFSRPTSNQASNKDLFHTNQKAKLNKSCNYHYSQLHQRLQSKAGVDIKKKLLNEILRGSHSNVSTSYLISTLKEKVGKRIQKYNTTEDQSSFIVPPHNEGSQNKKNDCLKLLESSLAIEINLLKDKLTNLTGFQELLERMEQKEQAFKISVFGELKKTFSNLQLHLTSQMNLQKMEIDQLCRQNVSLKQQLCQLAQNLAKCKTHIEQQAKQLKTKSEETFISIMNTLRSHGVDPRKMLKKQSDNVDTCKLKHQPESTPDMLADEFQKYSSDDSIPFVDPSTINMPMEKKGLSLNLNPLKDPNKAPIGYQDEFMANINEFSESWRQQALAEKRF